MSKSVPRLIYRFAQMEAHIVVFLPEIVRTISEQIVSQLRKEILAGELVEGAPLRTEQLARRFGVSRGPVRDALQQLLHEGLVTSEPNVGMRVGHAPDDALRSLVADIRRRVETFALERLLDLDLDVALPALTATLDDLRLACERHDLAALTQSDIVFHRTLIELAGGKDLLAIWQPVVGRMLMRYNRHQDVMDSFAEHSAIVEAVRRRDRAAAIEALQANIQ